MWFIGVEVEQDNNNPRGALACHAPLTAIYCFTVNLYFYLFNYVLAGVNVFIVWTLSNSTKKISESFWRSNETRSLTEISSSPSKDVFRALVN